MPDMAGSRVAIVGGTGRLGLALAKRLHASAVYVVLGSRDPARAIMAARSIGLPAPAGLANVDATVVADVIIVTVPFHAHAQILSAIAAGATGKIVVDTTVPLARSGPVHRPDSASAAEEARALVPTARLVAGFHTVSALMLANLSTPPRGDVLLCGDDPGAKEAVAGLVRRIGMRPVDAGPLSQARVLEQLAGLLLILNRQYKKRDLGIQIVGLDDVTDRNRALGTR
jgi:NADPH-dependent F420 reductase